MRVVPLALSFSVAGTLLAQEPVSKDRVALDSLLPRDTAVLVGTLPNGMRYYIRRNSRPEQRAELRLVVNAGSVLEDNDQRGLAHFVEHMAFNGTERFRKQELVNLVERMGMRFGPHLNAYTSFDETVYQLQVPTDSARLLGLAFQMLEDWARGITFDTAEVRKERGVVIEEWRLGQGAETRMLRRELPVVFRGSRYAVRLPIGERHVLERVRPALLQRYYRDWYRPDLMAVVAVGDFDLPHVERLIRETLGRVPARTGGRPRPVYPVPEHDSTFVVVSTDREATESQVLVYYKRPSRRQRTIGDFRRGIVEYLYTRMLNERLSEMTRRPDAPFIQAFTALSDFVRSGEVYVLGALVADGGIERGLEALLLEAQRVDRHGFTQTELDRAGANLLRAMERAYAERDKTNSGAFVSEYVSHFLEEDPFPSVATEFALTQRFLPGISLAEVNRVASEWITDRNRVIVARSPEKSGLRVPTERSLMSVFDRAGRTTVTAYVDSAGTTPLFGARPAPASVVRERRLDVIGAVEWTFANGVRVIAKPTDFRADEILFHGWSPGGHSLAPDEKHLTGGVAAPLIQLGGLGALNQTELRKKLAGTAAGATPFIGRDYEGIRGSAAPRDLEVALQLAHLAFTQPRLDSSAVQAFLQNVRGILQNRGASPESAFEDTVQVTFAQHHPRLRPLTVQRLQEVDPAFALAFYRDRFADASDFTFVFVGNLTLDSLRTLAASYLGTLPATGRQERWRDLGVRPPSGVVEREVRRGVEPKSRTQMIFHGTLDPTPENRYLLQSLAEVMSIELRERLREELGATYGVSVSSAASRIPRGEYSLTIDFGSAPERAQELVRRIFAYVDTLRQSGPDTASVEKVRESHRRGRETALRQNGYWLSQIVLHEQTGENPVAILDIEPLVRLLRSESLAEAARRWLDTRNYVRVTLLPEAGR